MALSSGLFLSDFPIKILHAFLISSMHSTCLFHQIVLDFITLIIFGEEYKLWSSSLCSLLQSPATSSLLGPNTFNLITKCRWIIQTANTAFNKNELQDRFWGPPNLLSNG
jgi:hypothetical protein